MAWYEEIDSPSFCCIAARPFDGARLCSTSSFERRRACPPMPRSCRHFPVPALRSQCQRKSRLNTWSGTELPPGSFEPACRCTAIRSIRAKRSAFFTGWPAALLPSGTLWNAAKPAIAPSEVLRTVDVIDSVHAVDTNQQNMADATFIFVIKPTLRICRRRQ